jgi:hypothetical protein
MSAVSVWAIASVFSGEERLIQKGENALKSNRLEKFQYDANTGTILATVKASMRDKSYKVKVTFIPEFKY